jgi:KaiC/GvpD/RAD55 family RecA-like ATPase
MAVPLEPSVVRIYSKSGKVVGAGFLVSSKHVLTCAHVVTDALGIPRTTQEQPDGVINLDFPLLAAKQLLAAKVIFWRPVNPNEAFEDIAGLELENSLPDTAQPAQLVTSEDLWGHPFRVLGFPAGQPNGVSASGVLRGRSANGWVQLEDVKQPGYRLEPGFSGAPVWDEELRGVAGMAVAAEMNRADVKAAFIIPTSILVSGWSDLGERAIPSCPYRGLFAFREQDAKFFKGRDEFTKQLVDAVQRQPLLAVMGASGSGKSSVVFAGLIPQLREQGNWLIESFRPKSHPLDELAAVLVRLREPEESKVRQDRDAGDLAKDWREGKGAVQTTVSRILEANAAHRLLLIADQFEELYTSCSDEKERQVFLNQLLETIEQTANFTLVLTLRADFLGYALSYRPLADALQNADVKLGPMNRQELQDAIAEPAQMLRVRIEEGLTGRILETVEKSPGNLPLLEFALMQLWAKQRNGQLTHDAYEEIGGVEKALASYASKVYGGLSEADKQRAQRVFIQLVRPGEGTEDTRRLATRAEVGEDNWDLVTRLADARLVVTGRDEGTGEETVEIVHEALIREWERLRGWMESDRSFRTWQERLRAAIRQWETSNNDEGALLRGTLLAEAEGWLQQRLGEISQPEWEFIQMSLALRDRLLREDEARIQRQLDLISENLEQERRALEQEKKARKAAKRTTFVTAISAIVLVVIGGIAWQKSQQARYNEILALAATIDGIANPELLDATNYLLKKANQLSTSKQEPDIRIALSNYRAVIHYTSLLKEQQSPQDPQFPPHCDQEQQDEIKKTFCKAEQGLIKLIAKERLPVLEQYLKMQPPKTGERINDVSTKFEEQFREGALKTTYAVLRREFGAKADIFNSGELRNDKEAERMPCKTLKAIEDMWYKHTGCNWFSPCKYLKGKNLYRTVFDFPYDAAENRLQYCGIANTNRQN